MVIDIANSIRYGSYKCYKLYSDILSDRILDFEDNIRNVLNLPDKIHIKLRPMRGVLGTARYLVNNEMRVTSIEIDARQNRVTFDNTLIHELIHAEQFYENRLEHSDDKTWFKWHGMDYTKRYENHIDLPWEAEAYERADYLTPIIFGYK